MRRIYKTPLVVGFFVFFLWNILSSFGIILASEVEVETESFYQARGRRDPFVPLVTLGSRQVSTGLMGVESIADVVINGIVYDPTNGCVVVINNTVLKEGEEQGSVKVLRVDQGGALLSINGMEEYKSQYETSSDQESGS